MRPIELFPFRGLPNNTQGFDIERLPSLSERYAVIEIGTRGLRLLIADASPLGIERTVYSTGDLSELGRNQTAKGAIAKESIQRTKTIVSRYVEIARQHRADHITAFATEIARSATNRRAFLKEVSTVIDVQVLRMEDEALYSFVASINAFRHVLPAGKTVMVVDQGGGSVELSCGVLMPDETVVLQDYVTLSLGTVKITSLLVQNQTLRDGFDNAEQIVRQEVERLGTCMSVEADAPAAVFGLGSGITSFAELENPERDSRMSSSWHLHGRFVRTQAIQSFLERARTRIQAKAIPTKDLAVDGNFLTLLSGVLTYYHVLTKCGAPGVTISRWGLRYGVLVSLAGQQSVVRLRSDRKADGR